MGGEFGWMGFDIGQISIHPQQNGIFLLLLIVTRTVRFAFADAY